MRRSWRVVIGAGAVLLLPGRGFTSLTRLFAPDLPGDPSADDALSIGPTAVPDPLIAAAVNILAFVSAGGGLVVEAEVFGPGSWTWVPFADLIGHSGDVNVATENVHITDPAHPVMAGLTDAGLSSWGFSIHSNFTTPERAGFDVLAVDVTRGNIPTIIARIPAPGRGAGADAGGLHQPAVCAWARTRCGGAFRRGRAPPAGRRP